MKPNRTTTRLLLLVVLAGFGSLLLILPPKILSQYELVREVGPPWTYVYFSAVGLGAALLLISTLTILWRLWRRTRGKQQRRQLHSKDPSQLTAAEQDQEVAENLASVEDLRSDPVVDEALRRELELLVQKVAAKRTEQQLEIVAFGTVSSGKSTLLNVLAGRDVFQTDARGGTTVRRNEIPWPGIDKVTLVDTPGLGEVGNAENAAVSASAARDADLILMVVDGPLRQSEFQLLEQLSQMEKRVLVCLNKRDWYGEREQTALLGQIGEQVKRLTRPEDVVAVEARPAPRTRVRVSADGEHLEESVEVAADIAALSERMLDVVRQDGRDLLLANLLLQSRGLVEEARVRVRQSLDRRAWQIVDRYAWAAGGAAALSPFPVLDLAAGAAVSTKMVLDLGRVYRQEVDLNTVVTLLGQLGKNLIAILGVSAAGPAIASAVASVLKTVPGAGTLAGGVLQGLVQALVTRWIGAVFIAYYRNEMQQPEGGLAALARREWDRMTTAAALHQLVQSARSCLSQHQKQESQP